ncbi:GntR family transcriptional regulator [Lonsdalea britannica]|uniref:conserved phage C-terminal domain-containing protein n=1 Tax=Lonsdalea britannica TaxID=1082704 RepID=UPI000A1DE072|nr:conserved phage C-terminal domain-containing protein [Lonsdalea britannica]OSN08377.1 GntR family transcriptional regulator [Lonsdalea britannica]
MSVKLTSYVWDGCAASGMKLTSVAILARLADFSSDEGVCWPSIETIARQLGAGISTVRTAIAKLESDGWLSRTQRRNGNRNASNMYQLNVEKLWAAANAHPPVFDASKSDASKSDRSKFDASKTSKNGSFHPPASGGDPSVNSKHDPSDKNTRQPAAQTDQSEPAKQVLNYFNQTTGHSYRDGKTTIGYIRGRLAEEYVASDLILVVDYLTAKWLNDPRMCDYLRPKTLFGPENFPEYYEKSRKWEQSGRPACVNGTWVRNDVQGNSPHWNSPEGWEQTL